MATYPVEMQLNIKTPARDGVELSSDIYLPKTRGTFPTVLMRTPYSNNMDGSVEKGRRLANCGYACVIQDCRGRWDSDGDYYPFREAEDGYDTQEWIGRQEWSDGKIGMSGSSYGGCVQWTSAPLQSSHLTCMVPRVMAAEYYNGLVWPGGTFQLNVLATWGMRTNGRTGQSIDFHNWTEAFRTLPVGDLAKGAGRDLAFWQDWMDHSTDDSYWEEFNDELRWGDMLAPAYIMGGWYDLYANQTFTNLNGMRLEGGSKNARRSRLIVGPWPHALSLSSRTGDVDFGANSLVDLEAEEMRWFDYWMRDIDNGIVDEPPLRLFIMGSNRWQDEHEWPLARTKWERWYLHSNGKANTVIGDGVLSTDLPRNENADTFVYDPEFPVPTMGGNNCCSPHIVPWGPYDQRPVEMRNDVLCYTSQPMPSDVEVIGPIKLVLYAATDGLDSDWTAKLVDVSPDGYAMNLCDGILRARYRESFSEPKLLEAGKVYEYEIEVGVTGNCFRKGHQIRLEVSSSNFPRFDRNLNTGGDPARDANMRRANQSVHHTSIFPSHLLLPLIPQD